MGRTRSWHPDRARCWCFKILNLRTRSLTHDPTSLSLHLKPQSPPWGVRVSSPISARRPRVCSDPTFDAFSRFFVKLLRWSGFCVIYTMFSRFDSVLGNADLLNRDYTYDPKLTISTYSSSGVVNPLPDSWFLTLDSLSSSLFFFWDWLVGVKNLWFSCCLMSVRGRDLDSWEYFIGKEESDA